MSLKMCFLGLSEEFPRDSRTSSNQLSVSTFLLLNTTCPVLANSVDPDQLASEETNWSGSALFVIKYMNFYKKKTRIK